MRRSYIPVATRTIGMASQLATASLVLGVSINFVNIVARYFFHASIVWAEEVMLFLMIASIFLGSAVASLHGAHISMDIILNLFPPRARRVLHFVNGAIFIVVAVVLIWLAIPVISNLSAFDQRSEAARIPIAIPQALIPLGLFLMIIATVLHFLHGERERPNEGLVGSIGEMSEVEGSQS